jgi:hypothetical protein
MARIPFLDLPPIFVNGQFENMTVSLMAKRATDF